MCKSTPTPRHLLFTTATIALCVSPLPSWAQSGTWAVDADGLWSETTNWGGETVASGADSTADFGTLDITAPRTVDLDSPFTIGHLSFDDISGSNSWTLGNNSDDLNLLTLAVTSGTPTISTNSSTTISAIIDGSDGMTKTGQGDLVLSGANTFSGVTSISEGTLAIEHAQALGAVGAGNETVVSSGSTLTLRNNVVVSGEELGIAGSGASGLGSITGGGSEWQGQVSLTADASVGSTLISGNVDLADHTLSILDTGKISGDISGTGNVVGNGSLVVLEGTNTYSGTTSVQTGELRMAQAASLYNGNASLWTNENITVENGAGLLLNVGGAGEFSLTQAKQLMTDLSTNIDQNGLKAGASFGIDTTNASGPLTFDQVIADSTGNGAGSLSFTKAGTGGLILDQANTYSGDTWIQGGELILAGGGTLGDGSGSLVMTGGSLDLGGTTQAVSSVTNNTTEAVGFNDPGNYTAITNGSLVSDGVYQLSGEVSANLGGTASLSVGDGSSEPKRLILSGANTYSGGTSIQGGELILAGSGTLGDSTGSLVMTGGSLDLGGTTQTVSSVTNNTTEIGDPESSTSISNGSLVSDGVYQLSGDVSANLGGTASLSVGGGGFLKTLTLSGVNDYSGKTSVGNQSFIAFTGPESLYNGDSNLWTSDNISIRDLSTFRLGTGFSVAQAEEIYNNLRSSDGGDGLTSESTFHFDTGASDVTWNSALADSVGDTGGELIFAILGTGVTTLAQSGSATGDFLMQGGGQAKFGADNATGTGGITAFGNSSVDFNGFNATMNNAAGTFVNSDISSVSEVTFAGLASDVGTSAYNSDFTGQMGGAGQGDIQVRKTTDNTLDFDGFAVLASLVVEEGTLVMNGDLSSDSGTTVVNDSATIMGDGTVADLQILQGGTINPGNSPGVLNTQNLDMAGTFVAEIDGNSQGQYDQINVTGSVTLSGMLALSMSSEFTPTAGDLFFLIMNDGTDEINGNFDGLAQGSEFEMEGVLWTISYDADSDLNTFNGGNDAGLMAVEVVPEPAAFGLIAGMLMLGYAGVRRRR